METRGGIYLQSRERKKGQEPGIQGRAEQHSTGKSKRRCGGGGGMGRSAGVVPESQQQPGVTCW